MVLIVHAIEAYMLNPIIYGRHMKMHPVAILVILVVGEHLFGIWGLLLGVPVAAFVWTYVIQEKDVRTVASARS
jgi:predicted PurR-regulated permease PerM